MSQLELLVVSEDEYNTGMFQSQLQSVTEWNSAIVKNEECAIEKLYGANIDIIVLAGNFPKLNGILKAQFANVEVVELSDEAIPYLVETVEAKIAEHNKRVSNNYAVRDDAFMGFHAAE